MSLLQQFLDFQNIMDPVTLIGITFCLMSTNLGFEGFVASYCEMNNLIYYMLLNCPPRFSGKLFVRIDVFRNIIIEFQNKHYSLLNEISYLSMEKAYNLTALITTNAQLPIRIYQKFKALKKKITNLRVIQEQRTSNSLNHLLQSNQKIRERTQIDYNLKNQLNMFDRLRKQINITNEQSSNYNRSWNEIKFKIGCNQCYTKQIYNQYIDDLHSSITNDASLTSAMHPKISKLLECYYRQNKFNIKSKGHPLLTFDFFEHI